MSGFEEQINKSTTLLAIASLIGSMGNRYIQLEIGEKCDGLLCGPIGRKLVIFSIVFMTTRDIRKTIYIGVLFLIVMKLYDIYKQHTQRGSNNVSKKE